MKKLLCALLCAVVFFSSACGEPQRKYDYTVPDREMNGMFDVDLLQKKTVTVEKVAETDGVEGFLLEGMPYADTRVNRAFFWVGKPQGTAPSTGWPAVLLLHGGGGNAFADWVKFWNGCGYVALALDVGGKMFDSSLNLVPNREFYCDGSWGSVGCGTDEAAFSRSWTYMNICNAILAHNYLRSLSYVDSGNTVATGISWGGYLTCILSGLDKRFCGFAPVYGCGSMDTDSWGLNTAGLSGLSETARAAWRAVYDPTAYLPYSTRPMLFVSGLTDHAFSSVSHKKSTELIPGKVFYAYAPSLEHGHYYEQTPAVGLFFEHILNDTALPVNFLSASFDGGEIALSLEGEIDGALLVYTLSTERDSHAWKWERKQIDLTAGQNAVAVPEGAVAALVIGYDEDYSSPVASTDLFFAGEVSAFQ